MFPKIWENSPNHPFLHRVVHYFHHPFWGKTPLFLETAIYIYIRRCCCCLCGGGRAKTCWALFVQTYFWVVEISQWLLGFCWWLSHPQKKYESNWILSPPEKKSYDSLNRFWWFLGYVMFGRLHPVSSFKKNKWIPGFAIIPLNNPKKLQKPWITKGQYLALFRVHLSCNKVLMVDPGYLP